MTQADQQQASTSAELAAERIVAVCHILVGEGLVHGFGHASVRLGSTTFAISGKVPLGSITAREVVVISADGPDPAKAALVPVEVAMHRAVYAARPDVGAITRTHGEFGSVLSLLGQPVRAVHAFGATLGMEVPVYDTCELIENDEQAARVVAVLGSATAALMRGNGQLVCGSDLIEACVLATHMEESARLQCRARSIDADGALRYLSPDETLPASTNLRSRPQLLRAFKALCDRHAVSWPAEA